MTCRCTALEFLTELRSCWSLNSEVNISHIYAYKRKKRKKRKKKKRKKKKEKKEKKKNISETVIRKKENISENSDKEKYKW